jgi:predicted nucleic acid-binding protein
MDEGSQRTVVADSGAVIALSRNNQVLRARFRAAHQIGMDIRVPVVVVAEAVRGNGPRDAPVNLVLAQTEPRYPLTEEIARQAGQLSVPLDPPRPSTR